jgi:hypothetical protein
VIALFVGAGVDRFIERRPKLVVYYGHVSAHTIKGPTEGDPNIHVHTHSIVLRNAGRLPSRNVRVHHAIMPINVNVFPSTQYTLEKLPDNSTDIVFPTIRPSEEVTVSYLYYSPLTYNQINDSVKSDDGPAKVLHVIHFAPGPRWLINAIRVLSVIGIVTLLYLLVALVQHLVH